VDSFSKVKLNKILGSATDYSKLTKQSYYKMSKDLLYTLKKIPQYAQRSNEWFEQRKNKLTSSDIATALGLNPYKKSVELLLEKCGLGKTMESNDATLHGQKYEDEAIEKYCYLMGKKNHTFGMISYSDLKDVRSEHDHTCEFLGGSPDGVAEDLNDHEELILLEVKCPLKRSIKHGQIPEYYYPQVQFNMFIMNLNKADFIEYIPPGIGKNVEMNIVRTHLDHEWLRESVKVLKDFWKEVQYWRNNDITKHPEYDKYTKGHEVKVQRMISATYLFIEDPDSDSDLNQTGQIDLEESVFD
jgi:putative phage-type endonuclease